MIQKLKAIFGLAIASCLAVCSVAHADVIVTPKVGYSFNTPIEDHSLKLDKDAMLYGVGLTKTLPGKFAVELEATQIDSNYDSQTYSVNGYKYFGDRSQGYVFLGAGYAKTDVQELTFESPVVNFGVGYRHRLTNMLSAKVEMRDVHQTKQNHHDSQFLVGIDFNLSELDKPYSR